MLLARLLAMCGVIVFVFSYYKSFVALVDLKIHPGLQGNHIPQGKLVLVTIPILLPYPSSRGCSF